MTVPVQDPVTKHVANGITTVFPFEFLCLQERDLAVYVDDQPIDSTAYTVTGLNMPSGSVIFTLPPGQNTTVTIMLRVVLARDTNYQYAGDFLTPVVNPDFDRLWLALQGAWNTVTRALQLGFRDTDGAGSYRANNNRIQDVGTPVDSHDAANAQWVKEQISSAAIDGAGQFVVDRLADPADPNNAAGMSAYGPQTQYPAGSAGWKLHRSQSRNIHKAFATDYSAASIVLRDGSADSYHRHFGGIVEGLDGRLHMVYRRAAQHALTSGATLYYSHSDDGGRTVSDEVMMASAQAGFDQRGCSMIVTPSGRLLCIHDKCPVPAAAPTTFHVVYSDNNGDSAPFKSGGQVASVPYAYARSYGRIKLIPGKDGKPYRLAWTPYYQSGSSPSTYRASVWLSDAESDGLQWTESTPIVDDTTGYNECELVAINADIWFAVIRGPNGLGLFKTIDGGVTWLFVGIVPMTSTDNQVAPSLDKFCVDGKWYLLLGYANRSTDTLVWRVADAEEALTSADSFGGVISSETDMVNASGYQCPVTNADGTLYVEGGMGYIEFKEYVGQTYSQVRFGRLDLFAALRANPRVVAAASGVIKIPKSALEPIIQVDTEGGASTDDVTDFVGGFDGQIVAIQGPQTTSARDVILRTDAGVAGPLRLLRDFRINTVDSRITLQRVGLQWMELGRTFDDTAEPALEIASGAITVPQCSQLRYFLVATEGGAATDTLTTINGGREGQVVILMSATSSQDTTITAAGGGNIVMNTTGSSFTLATSNDTLMLVRKAGNWYEVSRSTNG